MPEEKITYDATVICLNCGHITGVSPKMGALVVEHIKGWRCPGCQCEDARRIPYIEKDGV